MALCNYARRDENNQHLSPPPFKVGPSVPSLTAQPCVSLIYVPSLLFSFCSSPLEIQFLLRKTTPLGCVRIHPRLASACIYEQLCPGSFVASTTPRLGNGPRGAADAGVKRSAECSFFCSSRPSRIFPLSLAGG